MTASLVASALAAASLAMGHAPVPTPVQAAPEVVADVRVHGNHIASRDEIVAIAALAVGAPFQPDTLPAVTRRLQASGRFRTVDVRKRFASIEDPSRIVVVIVVDEGPVRVELPDEPGGEVRVVRRRGLRNLMYLPILYGEDGYGFTYGARLAVVNWAGERSRLSFPLTWGGTKQAGVEFDRTFTGGPVSRIELGLSRQQRHNPAFEKDDDRARVWGRIEGARGPFRSGATLGWQDVSFAATDDTLRTVGADVAFDTRASLLLPRNAVLASASWERVAFGSGGHVDRTRLEGRGYVGLVGQTVLELEAVRQDASAPLPAYLRALLGGWSTLRGFEAGAFHGDTVVYGTAELRVPLTSVLSTGKIGVSAFVDTGAAYDDGERFQDATLRTGLGGSVWLTITAFQMNLSVAHGRRSDTRVNFGGGFVF